MNHHLKRLSLFSLAAGALLAGLVSTSAAVSTWNNATSGDWSDTNNWLPASLPGSGDNVIFDNSGTGVVGAGLSEIVSNIYTGTSAGASGAVLVSGGTLRAGSNVYLGFNATGVGTLAMSSGSMSVGSNFYIGYSGTGNLALSGGTITSPSGGYVGFNLGSVGVALVSGGTWTSSSSVYLGNNGSGTMTVSGGGYVTAAAVTLGGQTAGRGVLTVNSGSVQGSSGLTVGSNGTGTVNLNGGRILTGNVFVGSNATGLGTIAVSGGTMTASAVTVGNSGTGTLQINSGLVSDSTSVVGLSNGARGSVTVSGGTWSSASLTVGRYSSSNSLAIQSGGVATVSGAMAIGTGTSNNAAYGSSNAVTLAGTNSTLTVSGTLTVGDYGSNNTLTVKDGALVEIGGTVVVSAHTGTGNFLQIDGGYIALFGNQTSYVTSTLLANNQVEIWDGTAWVTATGNPNFAAIYYATDADALAATGYNGLGGYTVMSESVPEPGTCALVALGLGALALSRRRMRRN